MPTVGDIAAALGFAAEGDLSLEVVSAAHPEAAGATDLALAMDPKYLPLLASGAARAAMAPEGTDWRALGLEAAIFSTRARFAMAGVTAFFAPAIDIAPGVHPSAVVDPAARIAPGAAVGPLAVVEAGAVIGARARLLGQATIGAGAEIGEDALIYQGVRIGRGVRVGARTIIHPNACVGSDGFSFVTPEKGAVEAAKEAGGGQVVAGTENRVHVRIHSLGAVDVGSDVEIGAGAMIDRGTVEDTTIGAGTKIDNLVQIGHNVRIGENCLLCGQVGVAGSARMGDRCVLGGQSGVADHAQLGDDVLLMAASALSGAAKSGSIMGGTPAINRKDLAPMLMAQRRLPRLLADVEALKKRFPDADANG